MFFVLCRQICTGMIVANIGNAVNGIGWDFWVINMGREILTRSRFFLGCILWSFLSPQNVLLKFHVSYMNLPCRYVRYAGVFTFPRITGITCIYIIDIFCLTRILRNLRENTIPRETKPSAG